MIYSSKRRGNARDTSSGSVQELSTFPKAQSVGAKGDSQLQGRTGPSGADFSNLPENVQQAVNDGLNAPGSQWGTLSDYLEETFNNAHPGRQLALLREMQHLTQQELAKAAGVRQADVSAVERGLEDVKFGTVRRIAASLGFKMTVRIDLDSPRSDGTDR